MLPKGGKEPGLAGIVLPVWPDDVTRLLEGAELLEGPLLLGTVEPAAFTEACWLAVLEVELDSCVDDDWLDEGVGLGCVRRELSNACDARYGAASRNNTGKKSAHRWTFISKIKQTENKKRYSIYYFSTSSYSDHASLEALLAFKQSRFSSQPFYHIAIY